MEKKIYMKRCCSWTCMLYRLTDDWRNQRVFLSAGCESRKATSAALKPDWIVTALSVHVTGSCLNI